MVKQFDDKVNLLEVNKTAEPQHRCAIGGCIYECNAQSERWVKASKGRTKTIAYRDGFIYCAEMPTSRGSRKGAPSLAFVFNFELRAKRPSWMKLTKKGLREQDLRSRTHELIG